MENILFKIIEDKNKESGSGLNVDHRGQKNLVDVLWRFIESNELIQELRMKFMKLARLRHDNDTL